MRGAKFFLGKQSFNVQPGTPGVPVKPPIFVSSGKTKGFFGGVCKSSAGS